MIYSFSINDSDMKIFEELGLNVQLILRKANIPPRSLENGKYVLTQEQFVAIYEVIGKQIKSENILPLSKFDSKPAFIPATFAGLCADNGLSCIRRIAKYKKIIAPYNMRIEESTKSTSIIYEFEDGESMPCLAVLYEQINILSIIRKGTGIDAIKPVSVILKCNCPENVIEYYGIRSIRGNSNKITFNNEDLKHPFITENNNMWDYLENELNQRLREMERDKSFSAAVRKILLELMPGGISDAEKIASELGISKRTLQRKLKEEGTTYNEQLNHTRELLVRNYLKLNMTLDEIAFLVNYADSKSLSRAFRIWTGMSVTDYKKKYALKNKSIE